MNEKIPPSHDLIKMFLRATKRAFRCYPELYDRDVSDHICFHILIEFVRTDCLYWVKNENGLGLEEIPDMILEGDVLHNAKSMEKELAVQEHIGNYSLFMAGLFPGYAQEHNNISEGRQGMKDRIFMELYLTMNPKDKGLDYYMIQGKRAYEKASRIYKGLNDIKSSLLKKLSQQFESYACLMQAIQEYLLSPSLNF